jgi:hypothetical protein
MFFVFAQCACHPERLAGRILWLVLVLVLHVTLKAKDKGNTNRNRKVLRRKTRLRMTSAWVR